MKTLLCLFLSLLLLSGCTTVQAREKSTYLDVFDTVTTIIGDTAAAEEIHDELLRYHRLFDIYNTYEGLNNLKTVNDRAGIAPVEVDEAVIELLSDCMEYYRLTDGRVNIAMGSVLRLWHTAREESLLYPESAYIPSADALSEAAEHTDIANLIIDREHSTVYLADGEMSLDVGAVAKGWAAQKAAESAPEGMLLSLGGNVVATGPKEEDTPWTVGVQDPHGGGLFETIPLYEGAMVTSGDYQRTYTVNGTEYPHIIDPETGMPAMLWSSVTVTCPDSGLADALSTALFLMPFEEGMALCEICGAEALYVDKDGNRFSTEDH
ncbi:MAG: FAD:protein FMN transferase [Oscillospiraceae bacterium]|nr:FAD:protein FMN transferase [Oscillospiraceae bacterium]